MPSLLFTAGFALSLARLLLLLGKCWCCYYWPVIARDFTSRRLIRVGIHIPWQNTAGNVDLVLKGKHRREELKPAIEIAALRTWNDDRTSVTHSLFAKARAVAATKRQTVCVCVWRENRLQCNSMRWHRRWILIGFRLIANSCDNI